MLTKASFALVATLVLTSASTALAARTPVHNYDQRNSTVISSDTAEQSRFDHAKGYIGG